MFKKFIFSIVAVCLISACASGPGPDKWFTDRKNPTHWADEPSGSNLPLRVEWTVTLDGAVRSSAVGGHGHLYIGTDAGTFYALDPENGAVKWKFKTGGRVGSAATAIDDDGFSGLFVTSEDGNLYSLDPATGKELWRVKGDPYFVMNSANYVSNVAAAQDETPGRWSSRSLIYVAFKNLNSHLRSVDAQTGALRWETKIGWAPSGPMVAGRFGALIGYEAVYLNYKRFAPEDGRVLWETGETYFARSDTSGVAGFSFDGSPDLVFTSIAQGRVKALNMEDGSVVWDSHLNEADLVTGFALRRKGESRALIVGTDQFLYSMDPPTGKINWSAPIKSNPLVDGKASKPAIWGDYVFQVNEGRRLNAYTLAGGKVEWSYELDDVTRASPTPGNGRLYIGTKSGKLYSFVGE